MSDSTSQRRRRWWQFSLRAMFIVVTLCCVALFAKRELDWQRKKGIAKHWASIAIEKSTPLGIASPDLDRLACPEALELPEQLEVLRIGMTSLSEAEQRVACLKVLAERFPEETRGLLRQVALERTHADVRALALQLLALFRQPEDIDLVLPLLKCKDAPVRAAAADCLGIIHCPSYKLPLGNGELFGIYDVRTASEPAIYLYPLISHIGQARFGSAQVGFDRREIDVSATVRQEVERVMLTGEDAEERGAAARALIAWPPSNYKFRVAEWGVWFDDSGELKLAQSIIDEIPEFVHHTYNSVESFRDRVNHVMFVTKPIVHVTVDRPMAIDIDVGITWGRPWFAYPRPDQFSVQVGDVGRRSSPAPDLARFDRKDAGELQPLAEGFPFLRPSFRTQGDSHGMVWSQNGLIGLGLRWQSLIVSPDRLPWMNPPELGGDDRHAWWGQLRQVSSSWVSSQGESERFLYYDGPTLAKAPLRFAHDGRTLTWRQREMFGGKDDEDDSELKVQPATDRASKKPCRLGLLIRVDGDRLVARRFTFAATSGRVIVADAARLDGQAVLDAFTRMLTDYGLTADEAGGLFRSWENQFFHTDGTRLITLLLPNDYDLLCPLTVQPEPTETVRVGLLLTDFP